MEQKCKFFLFLRRFNNLPYSHKKHDQYTNVFVIRDVLKAVELGSLREDIWASNKINVVADETNEARCRGRRTIVGG